MNLDSSASGGNKPPTTKGQSLVLENENPRVEAKSQIESMYEPLHPYKLPKDLYDIAPNLKIFDKLIETEDQLDKLLQKKRIDIQEQLTKPFPKCKRTLRMHIFNTYSNQPEYQTVNREQPKWTIRIQGKLLDTGGGIIARKFTYFFKSVQVYFDKNEFPGAEPATWRKSANSEADGFEITRNGSNETKVHIVFHLYSNPAKFKLPDALANILGIKLCTRIEVLNALWEYIKFNKLQSKENKSIINNDVPLREIFGCDKLSIDSISLKLKSILLPPDPIVLTHHVKLNGDWKITEQIYDIIVETDFLPVNYEIMPLFSEKISVDEKTDKATQANKSEHYLVSLSQKIKKLEKRATEYIDKLKKHKQKKACFAAYQEDPAKFINKIILEQNSYLRHMSDNDTNETDNPNSMKFLLENEDLIEREIKKYLDKKDDS